jgi:ATP/maltotriose-dependent transcriptional regulator MalT
MNSIFNYLLLISILFVNDSARSHSLVQNQTDRVNTLLLRANKIADPAASLIILNQAYQYIYELNDSLEANLYYNLGVVHGELLHTDSLKYFFTQALNIASNNLDESTEIRILDELADIARDENNYKLAMNYYSLAYDKIQQRAFEEKESSKRLEQRSVYFKVFGSSAVLVITTFLVYFILRQRKRFAQEVNELKSSSTIQSQQELEMSFKELNEQLSIPLSQREYEVLSLVIINKTNSIIAEELFVSVNTVKTHLKNIFEKMGVINRKDAIEKVITIKNVTLT